MNLERAVDEFVNQGFCVIEVEDHNALDKMSEHITRQGQAYLRDSLTDSARMRREAVQPPTQSPVEWREHIHSNLPTAALNDFRLNIIQSMAEQADWQNCMYRLAKTHIDAIVGNELAVQRQCNLSIQCPQDTSSLLPLHSDVWAGNSPYELVLWVPLVDCRRTQCMYILPKKENASVIEHFHDYQNLSAEAFFQALAPKVQFVEINYGQALIFWHSLIHGNRLNEETKTRWSLNFRFKSLLSPYGNKGLGDAFIPFSVKPLTRLGYGYCEPVITSEGL